MTVASSTSTLESSPVISWQDLWTAVRNQDCKSCSLSQHSIPQKVCLMGMGPVPCDWMFIGEAPGAREQQIEKPFSGPVGQYFDLILENVGIDREQAYITNVCKCKPPHDDKPTDTQISACRPYLLGEIRLVRPKKILLIGDAAIRAITGKTKISAYRGKVLTINIGGLDYPVEVYPIYHPGFIRRNPRFYPVEFTDLLRFKGGISPPTETHYEPVTTMDRFKSVARILLNSAEISFDVETEDLDPWKKTNPKLICISLANKEGYSYSVLLEGNQVTPCPWTSKELSYIYRVLSTILSSSRIHVSAFNAKFDHNWLKTRKISSRIDYDPMLAVTLLDENLSHSLEASVQFYLDPNFKKPEPSNMAYWPWDNIWPYNCGDSDWTLRLEHKVMPVLRDQPRLQNLFDQLIMPASKVLANTELDGIYVNEENLHHAREVSEVERDKAELAIREHVPEGYVPPVKSKKSLKRGFNPGSPKQLGDLLFNVLGLPVIEYTAGGDPSTAESVLMELKSMHPIMEDITAYRQYGKYLSTYIDPWEYELRDRWGLLHPHYHMRPVTGRLSSTDPNLQQAPRDRLIRSCLGAPPGYSLLAFDYSQIEIRLVAHASGDPELIAAYQRGEDIHLLTASMISGIPIEELRARIKAGDVEAKELRKKAKAVNFGLLYGMGAYGLQEYAKTKYGVEMTIEEATLWRQKFFERYPKLLEWHERMRNLVHKYHYVDSIIGRRRHLNDILSSDSEVIAEAERMAINSPIQGLASDFTLMTVVEVMVILPRSQGWLAGLVHDQALFIIKNEYVTYWKDKIKYIMENPPLWKFTREKLLVPVVVDLEVGQNWN